MGLPVQYQRNANQGLAAIAAGKTIRMRPVRKAVPWPSREQLPAHGQRAPAA